LAHCTRNKLIRQIEFLKTDNELLPKQVPMKHVLLASRFIVFGKAHFDYIVSEYLAFYHECGPHQGIGNILLPRPRSEPDDATAAGCPSELAPLSLADVKCETRISGLLKHFYREAA
jgi:hypothetical protein